MWAHSTEADSVDWICRKGNDEEELPCCRCCWNSCSIKAELGYDMDAGIEVEIEGTVGAGVDGSSDWEIRRRWRAKPRHRPKRSCNKGGGRGLNLCSSMIIPKVQEMRRGCKRRRVRKH